MTQLKYKFFIDRGGTFTDCYFSSDDDTGIVKLLSEDPINYPDAPREAIRRVLASRHDLAILQDPYRTFPATCDQYQIETIRMGTTVATNALLEHKGAKFAFVTTRGFADLLEIAYQNRPKIFDLRIKKPEQLYEQVVELDERILTSGIEKVLDLDEARLKFQSLLDSGINKLAIAFLHSYANPVHEQQLKQLAHEMGFKHISCSSDLSPMIKIVPRADTACIDAYLSPVLNDYIKNFQAGFSDGLSKTELLFMKSDAGLAQVDNFSGYNSILSGPAGGVVGLSSLAQTEPTLIGFDMGGTSTDVSRFAGDYELVFETQINGHRIQAAQLDIQTVAAGGGSRLFYEDGMFKVGPESSGSHPGPVSYGKGGYLSITDANLVLGRLLPEHFPKVFGANADQPLDKEAATQAFAELAQKINADRKDQAELSIEEIASGFVQVANEAMARPIREISIMKGHDIKTHALACFGGAGAQHACELARDLGISKVLVHRYSGILSAYGMALADEVVEKQQAVSMSLPEQRSNLGQLEEQFDSLISQIKEIQQCIIIKYLNLRYQGTDTQMMIQEPDDRDYAKAFKQSYKKEFGFDLQDREILVDDIRIRAVKKSDCHPEAQNATSGSHYGAEGDPAASLRMTNVYFDKWYEAPVYKFDQLGSKLIQGPAIIMQDTATIVLDPWSEAALNSDLNLEILVKSRELSAENQELRLDPIKLSVFSSRFMSIAEQMGRSLEKTSISTNIKERLDFSCAIFDSKASLVANAPHQPVHLGSMGHAVAKQVASVEMRPGDSFLTNHPLMGGSHLPDLTVITPVYDRHCEPKTKQPKQPLFYVANRAHHADVGGISPGSMPSFSTRLDQEGIAIKTFKLVDQGEFQETELRKLLASSRTIEDNVSDLKAQIAANTRGIELINSLIDEFGQEQVFFYMQAIQEAAEQAVRLSLRASAKQSSLESEDYLDDGSMIKLKINIDKATGSAVFDFTGTSAALETNLNTPEAVTSSAILYALRAMIDKEIPLNQGCLKPITIIIPEASLLKPKEDAAVVAGNVLTSQRIVDVIFKAFGTCAASQGCMNNISFGNESFGYYETIGGGAGAGPDWDGASGVHTHMTNTRITDPEILETRYPVILREFSIRHGSGGKGKHRGGDGLVRVFEFLDDLQVSILTERRERAPYGLAGGGNGARGENWLEPKAKPKQNLGAKNSIKVSKSDKLRILTPGAGAYGS